MSPPWPGEIAQQAFGLNNSDDEPAILVRSATTDGCDTVVATVRAMIAHLDAW
jgi:hypothetical protein